MEHRYFDDFEEKVDNIKFHTIQEFDIRILNSKVQAYLREGWSLYGELKVVDVCKEAVHHPFYLKYNPNTPDRITVYIQSVVCQK